MIFTPEIILRNQGLLNFPCLTLDRSNVGSHWSSTMWALIGPAQCGLSLVQHNHTSLWIEAGERKPSKRRWTANGSTLNLLVSHIDAIPFKGIF